MEGGQDACCVDHLEQTSSTWAEKQPSRILGEQKMKPLTLGLHRDDHAPKGQRIPTLPNSLHCSSLFG